MYLNFAILSHCKLLLVTNYACIASIVSNMTIHRYTTAAGLVLVVSLKENIPTTEGQILSMKTTRPISMERACHVHFHFQDFSGNVALSHEVNSLVVNVLALILFYCLFWNSIKPNMITLIVALVIPVVFAITSEIRLGTVTVDDVT